MRSLPQFVPLPSRAWFGSNAADRAASRTLLHSSVGAYADDNPMRWGSLYQDRETGFHVAGGALLDPQTGRTMGNVDDPGGPDVAGGCPPGMEFVPGRGCVRDVASQVPPIRIPAPPTLGYLPPADQWPADTMDRCQAACAEANTNNPPVFGLTICVNAGLGSTPIKVKCICGSADAFDNMPQVAHDIVRDCVNRHEDVHVDRDTTECPSFLSPGDPSWRHPLNPLPDQDDECLATLAGMACLKDKISECATSEDPVACYCALKYFATNDECEDEGGTCPSLTKLACNNKRNEVLDLLKPLCPDEKYHGIYPNP